MTNFLVFSIFFFLVLWTCLWRSTLPEMHKRVSLLPQTGLHTLKNRLSHSQNGLAYSAPQRRATKNAYRSEGARQRPCQHRPYHQDHRWPWPVVTASADLAAYLPVLTAAAAPCAGSVVEYCLAGPCLLVGKWRTFFKHPWQSSFHAALPFFYCWCNAQHFFCYWKALQVFCHYAALISLSCCSISMCCNCSQFLLLSSSYFSCLLLFSKPCS